MAERLALIALLTALLAGGTPLTAADTAPPRNLQLVDGHWTAWEPPSEIPEGVQVHIIEPGDTLWDLAGRFYEDPYLWPQLWENNRYILDAHWIYPGDPLLLGMDVEAVDNLGQLGEEGEGVGRDGEGAAVIEDDLELTPLPPEALRPVPLGTETDIYCSGYIGEEEEGEHELQIVGSEFENLTPNLSGGAHEGAWGTIDNVKYGMATGDIVYTNGGRAAGMRPGDSYTIIQAQSRIVHPLDRDVFGRYYRYTGRLRILSAQEETAIAEIVHACDSVVIGNFLEPFEPEPVPLARVSPMRPVNFPTDRENLVDSPVIVYAQDDIVSLAQDNVVFIDRGSDHDVVPGDIFTIYRVSRRDMPPLVLGELAVLSVHDRASVARIISSRYSIYLGDRLELK